MKNYKIEITKKNMKNIRVSVKAGTLLVSAPKYATKKDILKVIENNEKSIDEMIEKEKNKLYQNDLSKNIIYLFGETINIEDAKKINTIDELENFYRKNLLEILPYIFKEYNKITGLYEKEFKIRKMTARWGTCYPERGLINISLYLAKRSVEEIKLVVLHELIHLKIRNHSKDFYSEINKYMKNYKEVSRRLNN